jgi:tRNA-dihydrouridine synthase B
LDSDDLLLIAEGAGISFATVHARTRAQGYSGKARWNEARAARQKSQSKIPVVFNGDVKSAADVEAVKKLGADGAMIGRAMLGNPWLDMVSSPVAITDRGDIVMEHFESMISYYGDSGTQMFRKHLAWYASGRKGAAEFRRRVNQISDAAEMRNAITGFFNS